MMPSKNEQMKKLIEVMVQKEVRKLLPQLVPQIVKEIFSGLIMESKVTPPEIPNGNSNKRVRLQEVSGNSQDYEEYPTIDKSRMAALMGYGDMAPVKAMPFISERITEHGTAIPVDPNDPGVKMVNAAIERASQIYAKSKEK